MNILILCRHEERLEYDQIVTYQNALNFEDRKNTYAYGEFESVLFSYNGAELYVTVGGESIASFDAVFMIGWFKTKMLEDIALSVAKYAITNNVKVLNSEVLLTRSRSKLSQYVIAAQQGNSMVPFLFCKNVAILKSAIENWQGEYPVIAKGVQSSRGNDNYKLNNPKELLAILDRSDEIEGPWFVIQSFVPNNGDYRVIVMGDAVKMVIHRRSDEGSHLNNTSKGGVAQNIDVQQIPPGVRQECVKLAKTLHREVTGVDVIQHRDTGEFYLLEINNMPQLATGSFVPEKMKALDEYFGEL